MDYNAPTGSTDPNAPYVGKTSSTLGSKVPPHAAEYPQREIVNAELAAGLTPSNNSLTQLAQAMSIGLFIGTFGGSANALTGTIKGSVVMDALRAGMTFHGFVGSGANTGPVTLALSGFSTAPGAKDVLTKGGTPLAASDLPAGGLASVRFDGTAFRVVGFVQSDIQTIIANGNTTTGFPKLTFLTSSTTFTPTGRRARVTLTAGGGSGGAASGSASDGGGGGGGETIILEVDLTGVPSVACVVGVGGSQQNADSAVGNTGGNTSFGAFATALGGEGGFAYPHTSKYGRGGSGTGGTGARIPGGAGGDFEFSSTGGRSFWGSSGGINFSSSPAYGAVYAWTFNGQLGGGGDGGQLNYVTSGAKGGDGCILIEEYA